MTVTDGGDSASPGLSDGWICRKMSRSFVLQGIWDERPSNDIKWRGTRKPDGCSASLGHRNIHFLNVAGVCVCVYAPHNAYMSEPAGYGVMYLEGACARVLCARARGRAALTWRAEGIKAPQKNSKRHFFRRSRPSS